LYLEDVIKENSKINLTFFNCDTKKKTVHCGTCIRNCDKFKSCSIIKTIVEDLLRPTYILKSLGRMNMQKYLVFNQKKEMHTLETVESLETKKVPQGSKIYSLKNQYKVVNKLIAADKKVDTQKKMRVFYPTTNSFDDVNKLNLKTGDVVIEIGKEFKIVSKLIKIVQTRKKRKKKTNNAQPKR